MVEQRPRAGRLAGLAQRQLRTGRAALRALRGEVVPATDYLRIDPQTGAASVLSVNAVPLHLDDEQSPLAVLLIHDATRERAQTRELQAFAGVVAHDLFNPLTLVAGWAESLEEQFGEGAVPSDVGLPMVGRLLEAAHHMRDVIGDLLAYTVAQRGREIGIRMALGADRGRVRALVLRQVARLLLVGGALGVAGALALGRATRSLLYGMDATDPLVVAAAAALLALAAFAAGWVPAWRASRVSPVQALREG